MLKTERKGAFFIERREDLVVVRCAYPFEVILTRTIEASLLTGKDFSTKPFALYPGVRATLKGENLPDEVIDGDGGSAA